MPLLGLINDSTSNEFHILTSSITHRTFNWETTSPYSATWSRHNLFPPSAARDCASPGLGRWQSAPPSFTPALSDSYRYLLSHMAYRTLKGFWKIPQFFLTSEGLLTSKSEEMSPFYLWKCQEPLHIPTTVPSNPQQRRTITASVARGWLLIS